MYHENLNPKTIKVLKFNETNDVVIGEEEIEFNILDWVDDKIKAHFDKKEILAAIHQLDLTFEDLRKFGTNISVSILNRHKPYLPKVYHLTGSKTRKSGKIRYGSNYTTDTYSCSVPNDLVNGDLALKILQNRFEFFSRPEYNDTSIVSFDLKKFSTEFGKLIDLPLQLRSLTVEQLLTLNKVEYGVVKSRFFIYSNFEEFYYKPKSKIGNVHYPCLHINLEAMLRGDWQAIEENTRKYYTDYYRGSWSNVEANYPLTKDRMKWIDELFTLPDLVQLKADVQSLNNNAKKLLQQWRKEEV